jgi:DNA-binding MarR family transcriptional regulator
MKTQMETNDLRGDYYWNQVQKHGKHYDHFDWPSVEVLLQLIHTYDVTFAHFTKMMQPHGLSPGAFNVLMILSQSSGSARKQNEISKLLLVSRANITGLVDHLVQKGLVLRLSDRSDRRVCLVKITKKGNSLLETYLPFHYAEINRILSVLSRKEKKIFNELLNKLRNSIG